jgi:hypothetical protein
MMRDASTHELAAKPVELNYVSEQVGQIQHIADAAGVSAENICRRLVVLHSLGVRHYRCLMVLSRS